MTTTLDEKAVRTSPMLVVLGIIFAFFLCGLGTQFLSNIADLIPQPNSDAYFGNVQQLRSQRDTLAALPNPRQAQIARAERDLEEQERILKSAEASWRTWLETRATLGKANNEDDEVRKRRNYLDALRRDRDAAERTVADLKAQADPREARLAEMDAHIKEAEREAESAFAVARASWTWKVLVARLALVVPIWALALLLWNRRQRSRYITLVWGYWGFAAWMLLWGVLPYLPQYGGYLPLALGAGTTLWISMSLVRHFNAQAAQRRRRIVDRALSRHACPGCDRDYLIGAEGGLDAGLTRRATVSHYDGDALHPRNCPACGLALFGPCPACQHIQSVNQDFCSHCGAPWKVLQEA